MRELQKYVLALDNEDEAMDSVSDSSEEAEF